MSRSPLSDGEPIRCDSAQNIRGTLIWVKHWFTPGHGTGHVLMRINYSDLAKLEGEWKRMVTEGICPVMCLWDSSVPVEEQVRISRRVKNYYESLEDVPPRCP